MPSLEKQRALHRPRFSLTLPSSAEAVQNATPVLDALDGGLANAPRPEKADRHAPGKREGAEARAWTARRGAAWKQGCCCLVACAVAWARKRMGYALLIILRFGKEKGCIGWWHGRRQVEAEVQSFRLQWAKWQQLLPPNYEYLVP